MAKTKDQNFINVTINNNYNYLKDVSCKIYIQENQEYINNELINKQIYLLEFINFPFFVPVNLNAHLRNHKPNLALWKISGQELFNLMHRREFIMDAKTRIMDYFTVCLNNFIYPNHYKKLGIVKSCPELDIIKENNNKYTKINITFYMPKNYKSIKIDEKGNLLVINNELYSYGWDVDNFSVFWVKCIFDFLVQSKIKSNDSFPVISGYSVSVIDAPLNQRKIVIQISE